MAEKASGEVVRVDAEVMGAEIVQAQTAAEVDMQISTARKHPRSISRVKEKVLELATVDAETAAECWYALPRGGKVIEGPGTRMAEIVAASYGNLRAGCRVIAIEDKHVLAQGICHDLENNVLIQSEVRRRITDRNGRRYNDDMIVVTGNAAASIAFRNAVFKVVPKALLKGVMDKVKQIGMGEGRTITEHRKAIVEYFKGMGVAPKDVAKVVKKRQIEDITLEDVATLRGLATAIKEGTTSIEETFGGKKAPVTAAVPRGKIKPEPDAVLPPAAPAPEEPGGEELASPPAPPKKRRGRPKKNVPPPPPHQAASVEDDDSFDFGGE